MLPTFRCLYARGTEEAFALPRNPSARPIVVLGVYSTLGFVFKLTFTAADKDAMQRLEPAFENLLRSASLHEDVINALRKEEILDREMFVSLDSTEDGLAASAKDAFGVDPDVTFAHKKELAKLKKVWNQAKLQAEAKQEVDAVARAHGELVTMSTCD